MNMGGKKIQRFQHLPNRNFKKRIERRNSDRNEKKRFPEKIKILRIDGSNQYPQLADTEGKLVVTSGDREVGRSNRGIGD